MTESEAIKSLELCKESRIFIPNNIVLDMAIQALEEIQQYKAIGTIEEFKAIKQWKSDIIESFSKYDVNSVDELMKRFKELTEKSEPKKVKTRGQGHETDCFCPNCDAFLGDDQHWQFNQTKHCSKCGQNLEEY